MRDNSEIYEVLEETCDNMINNKSRIAQTLFNKTNDCSSNKCRVGAIHTRWKSSRINWLQHYCRS